MDELLIWEERERQKFCVAGLLAAELCATQLAKRFDSTLNEAMWLQGLAEKCLAEVHRAAQYPPGHRRTGIPQAPPAPHLVEAMDLVPIPIPALAPMAFGR